MKRAVTLLLLFFLWSLTSATLYGQKIDVYSWPRQVERGRNYDALHYRIKLRFDEARKTFWGENRITITPLEASFRTCVLDAEVLKVSSVQDAQSRPLKFQQTEDSLSVDLSRSYRRGERITFTVSYYSDNPKPDPIKYGMPKGYALGLDFKDETPGNPRLISTLSFPEGARHWFPCNDRPGDKVTGEVIATVRREYQALSNGSLVSVTEDKQAGTRTFHWSQTRPHSTYLFVLVAGPYDVIKDWLDSLPISYWVYKKDRQGASRSFSKTPEIIRFFNKEFGFQYPWVKYDQVTIPGIGGGAESTTATVVGDSIIHDERAEQDFPSAWLVAHEAAHQWWGDLVTMRTWSEAWINESFATYSEYLYSRHALGEEEGAVNLLQKKNAYLQEARTRYIRPIVFDRYRSPNDNFDRHTYEKGAAVLNMLRFVMGDKLFLKSLSHFLQKHAFKTVDTNDLMLAIKEASGQNLDWFFQQWVFKPGHPVFKVSYVWDEMTKRVRLKVIQTQDTSQGTPVFRMPLRIGIVTPGGRTSKTVWLENKEEVFELTSPQRPLMVRFDEGDFLLKELTFDKSVDELLYQIKHDEVTGRMWAARELGKFKDDVRAIDGLRQSALQDSFWAVRRAATETLGQLQKKELRDFLKEKSLDRNSKVRASALAALGDYKSTELVEFFKGRFEQDDSYIAQAEALRAIGKSRTVSSASFLEQAAKIRSPRNIIETAATWALQELRR